jgi:hypothetical protein
MVITWMVGAANFPSRFWLLTYKLQKNPDPKSTKFSTQSAQQCSLLIGEVEAEAHFSPRLLTRNYTGIVR